MYLDKPKSPSFTQSIVDTNTFRAAMSLQQGKEGRKGARKEGAQGKQEQGKEQRKKGIVLEWYCFSTQLKYTHVCPSFSVTKCVRVCVYIPVYKTLALQIRKGSAQLVGVQNKSRQV